VIFVGGHRYELKPCEAADGSAGQTFEFVRMGGPRFILQALASAKSAEIEFGGKRFSLSEKAMANCRELLKRSNEKAGQRK
jgi:hypothetical protein